MTIPHLSYDVYSSSLSQQKSFIQTNNYNNIIFEFTAFDISNQFAVLPAFSLNSNNGFNRVNAIAKIFIEKSRLNNLFYFKGYPYDDSNMELEQLPEMYGINMSHEFSIAYSNASVTSGAVNSTNNPKLKADYVNYLAYAITGGYNLANIFKNEGELLNEVTNMDSRFNTIINTNIANINNNFSTVNSSIVTINGNNIFFDDYNNNSIYINSCKELLNGLLTIADTPRGEVFFDDLENQSNANNNKNESYYAINFSQGDILSIVLNYIPSNGNMRPIIGLGDNLVYTRSYKILLECV